MSMTSISTSAPTPLTAALTRLMTALSSRCVPERWHLALLTAIRYRDRRRIPETERSADDAAWILSETDWVERATTWAETLREWTPAELSVGDWYLGELRMQAEQTFGTSPGTRAKRERRTK